jgi:predicted ribosome quality control (RQC) complex YloA/Tae2 family protein
MLLRKYLEGSRLVAVRQPPYERLLFLVFEGRGEMGENRPVTLVAEIMGRRSNILLLDGAGRILDAARRAPAGANPAREVLPGAPYVAPPRKHGTSPNALTADMVARWLRQNPAKPVEELLLENVTGIGPALSRHVCILAGLDGPRRGDTGNEAPEALVLTLRSAFGLDPKQAGQSPVVYFSGPAVLDYYCFHLAQHSGLRYESFSSMSEALDRYFARKLEEERFAALSRALRSAVKRGLERASSRLASQRRDLEEGMRADLYRLYGELLTVRSSEVPRGATVARLPNYYADGAPEVSIPLDPALDALQNARAYFKKYAKAKVAREEAERRLGTTEAEIAYLEQVGETIEHAGSIPALEEIRDELCDGGYMPADAPARGAGAAGGRGEMPRTVSASRPLSLRSSDGYEIVVGRNNKQNDSLTRSARPEDVWLHARGTPGAHVILRHPGDAGKPPIGWPPEGALLEAAALAAHYSKARGNTKVQVDYTFARHVWKPRRARPGMVLYDHEKTLVVRPDSRVTECTPR